MNRYRITFRTGNRVWTYHITTQSVEHAKQKLLHDYREEYPKILTIREFN
ncbi:hypothetical protein [Faucicola boevrei]|nr:hypothetical protein [Moraxella boevrei]